MDSAIRCRDPFVRRDGAWIVRRLSPNCSRIDLDSLAGERDEYRMLHSMGWETANVHLGSERAVATIRRDLNQRPASWLRQASKRMVQATQRDWQEWQNN